MKSSGFHMDFMKSGRFHVKFTQNLINSDVSAKTLQFGWISCEIERPLERNSFPGLKFIIHDLKIMLASGNFFRNIAVSLSVTNTSKARGDIVHFIYLIINYHEIDVNSEQITLNLIKVKRFPKK